MNEWGDFHRPAFRDWRWLETSWFGFFVPEHGIRGHIRAAFRTNQNVVFSMVNIYSRGGDLLDMDFFDSQMHVPLASTDRYSHFSLESGISYRGRPAPDAYDVRFHSRCKRVKIDLEYEALMPPAGLDFTTLADGPAGFAAFHRTSKADAPTGHIDQTFRVRGTLLLDGDHYDVDCVSNRDQSWSPRSEFNSMCGTFDNLHFGEEMTFSAQVLERPFGEPRVSHAYILIGAELRRVVKAEVAYERTGLITDRLRYDIEDEKGEQHVIEAETRHTITQDQGSNGITVMNYCIPRWKGKTGVGESMWHWDIPEMQRIVREARKTAPNASVSEIFTNLAKRPVIAPTAA
jgi:hypothetical protein